MKYIFPQNLSALKKKILMVPLFCALQILEISFLSILLETGY